MQQQMVVLLGHRFKLPMISLDNACNSISRAADGNLYVAGTGSNNARVVYLDGSDALQEFYLKP